MSNYDAKWLVSMLIVSAAILGVMFVALLRIATALEIMAGVK